MRSSLFHIIILVICQFPANLMAQSITLNNGFQELTIGSEETEVDEFVGFSGKKLSATEYKEYFINNADATALLNFIPKFDYCQVYNHIMLIPVTKIFFRNGKVVGIEINSYPDFTRPICLDLITNEGLHFWERSADMAIFYGDPDEKLEPGGRNVYYTYPDQNMAFGLSNDEIRIVYYY